MKIISEIIHVAIVEDDHEIRQTLALIIDGTPGFRCKYSYEDCESALASLPGNYINVVLMDVELPGLNGIVGVKKLKPQMPDTDFIMLTIRQDDDTIFNSICAGATGYLVKDTPPSELLKSIKEAHQGGAPMSANIARQVIKSFHSNEPSPLSDRETEVLKLLSQGMNYRTVAAEIYLSPHTVKTHIKNIYNKLHVNSRAEAIKKAIKDRLI